MLYTASLSNTSCSLVFYSRAQLTKNDFSVRTRPAERKRGPSLTALVIYHISQLGYRSVSPLLAAVHTDASAATTSRKHACCTLYVMNARIGVLVVGNLLEGTFVAQSGRCCRRTCGRALADGLPQPPRWIWWNALVATPPPPSTGDDSERILGILQTCGLAHEPVGSLPKVLLGGRLFPDRVANVGCMGRIYSGFRGNGLTCFISLLFVSMHDQFRAKTYRRKSARPQAKGGAVLGYSFQTEFNSSIITPI